VTDESISVQVTEACLAVTAGECVIATDGGRVWFPGLAFPCGSFAPEEFIAAAEALGREIRQRYGPP